MKQKIISLVAFTIVYSIGFAQSFSVDITITNQPKNILVFGSVKGDDFTPIDSTFLYPESNKTKFTFPENAKPGVYRIVMGQTPYAKVMDQSPQLLNFIFNNENLVLKTDFNQPVEKLEIIQSNENKIWFGFLSKDKIIQQEIIALKKELDYNWSVENKEKAVKLANEFNTLQMERDLLVVEWAKKREDLLVSEMIKNQRKPILDGYLTPKERIESLKKDFFNAIDFSDARLINSTVYTDNIFEYLLCYNKPEFTQEQREKEYIKAVDIIFQHVSKNPKVKQFISEYLIHGFEVLKFNKAIFYVSEKYKNSK